MEVHILTIFPEMFVSPFADSILQKAQSRGLVRIHIHNTRDFATDRHRVTDDLPYGGGPGMVMKPEPIVAGIHAIQDTFGAAHVVLLTPQGELFDQERAKTLAHYERLLLVCGRYAGLDARVQRFVDTELSIGDYVLTGGELPAMVVVDAVVRLVPDVLGDAQSAEADSLFYGILQGPVYTRPVEFAGVRVPSILRSGNHAAIAAWRRCQALWTTSQRRPELLQDAALSPQDLAVLREIDACDPPAHES
jgi:tRNA (guanine37-N1)-methyltransferase